jgi:hypothetical protein
VEATGVVPAGLLGLTGAYDEKDVENAILRELEHLFWKSLSIYSGNHNRF